MFEILPIKSIREEDLPLLGKSLINLAKLYHFELPVADGIIVVAPHLRLKTIVEHYEKQGQEIFEQSLHIVKSEIQKIPVPVELEKILRSKEIDARKVWFELLETWLSEIRSKIWREGFSPNLVEELTAQPVFFTKKILFSGEGYFNAVEKIVEIHSSHEKLTPEQILELDEMVGKANKKLVIPHIYNWIFDGHFKIVKVREFTQHPKKEPEYRSNKVEEKVELESPKFRTTVNVFLDASENLAIQKNIDGVIIDSEKIIDFETKIRKYSELARNFSELPVIYKLADVQDENNLRGALRLIHQGSLLKKDVEIFLFARNKIGMFNTQIAVPLTRSVNEFLQLKRDLAALGVSRKGSLKMWFEMGVPENFINLEEYLLAGFDGAIVNLDELSALLGGFNPLGEEGTFYKTQIKGLVNFLEDGLRLLKKAGMPVLFRGELGLNDEMIHLLIEKGLFGLIVNLNESSVIHERLRFVENRILRSRVN
jgi:hypothetical protein